MAHTLSVLLVSLSLIPLSLCLNCPTPVNSVHLTHSFDEERPLCYYGYHGVNGAVTFADALVRCAAMRFQEESNKAWLYGQIGPQTISNHVQRANINDTEDLYIGVVAGQDSNEIIWEVEGSKIQIDNFFPKCKSFASKSQGCVRLHRIFENDFCFQVVDCFEKTPQPVDFVCVAEPIEDRAKCPDGRPGHTTGSYGKVCTNVPPDYGRPDSFLDGVSTYSPDRLPIETSELRYTAMLLAAMQSDELARHSTVGVGLVTMARTAHDDASSCGETWFSGDLYNANLLRHFIEKRQEGICYGVKLVETHNDTHHLMKLEMVPLDCRYDQISHIYLFNEGTSHTIARKQTFVRNFDSHIHCLDHRRPTTAAPELDPAEQRSIIIVAVCCVVTFALILILMSMAKRRLKEWSKEMAEKKISKIWVVDLEGNEPRTASVKRKEILDELKTQNLVHSTEALSIERKLGSGAFGSVCLAKTPEPVALKTVLPQQNSETEQQWEYKTTRKAYCDRLLLEALVMSRLKHDHVVRLCGVYVNEVQEPSLAMELLTGGDLKAFLRANSGLDPLLFAPRVIRDIADGMAYLAARQFVHRDIAARNCLLTTRDVATMRAKIGDFGLTRCIGDREYYQLGLDGRIPINWIAPEVFGGYKFTIKSDVWSFGIFVRECFDAAANPYENMSVHDVIEFVCSGGHPSKPKRCGDRWFAIMKWCWSKAEIRPTAGQVLELLNDIQEEGFAETGYTDPRTLN